MKARPANARTIAGVIVVSLAGCSKASSEGESKQWPAEPPTGGLTIPANLSIAVTVDGAAHAPITSAVLGATKPDFADSDRMAWLVPTLVAEARAPGSVVAATGTAAGVAVSFAHPTSDGLEPVVFLTRRGEMIFSAVDPKEPFPPFHGRGGRLHRPGDAMPRVSPIATLAITHPTK